MMYVSQIMMLYTFNLYSAVYQLYLNKTGRLKKEIMREREVSLPLNILWLDVTTGV